MPLKIAISKIAQLVQNNFIVILAFAHQHRNPNYWIDSL